MSIFARLTLLGVPVDAIPRRLAVEITAAFLDGPVGHLITTPNPEMLVAAQSDPAFAAALRLSDLAIPDGFGLLLMARLRGPRIPERISGADFVDDIAALAAQKGKSMFLLGGKEGIAVAAAEALAKRHPNLHIVGAASGGRVKEGPEGRLEIDRHALELLTSSQPDIVLVAFGHGRQEKWIVQNLPLMPSVKIAMGVGGTFDFLAGTAVRAPKWLRNIGLEWLWRLIREPRRIGRIFTAVFIFPWLVITRRS